MDVLDAVDEVGGRQDGGVPVRGQLGRLTVLRAGERVPSIGQGPDALVAVVVAARQNLWVEVVLVADGASYLLAQFLHSLLDRIGTFRHRNSDTQQTLAAVSITAKESRCPHTFDGLDWLPQLSGVQPHDRLKGTAHNLSAIHSDAQAVAATGDRSVS